MIIGLAGEIGSGKDEFCKVLQYHLTHPGTLNRTDDKNRSYNSFLIDIGCGFEPVVQNRKFAAALKDIACRMLGCTREQLEDRDFKESYLPEEWWYISTEHNEKLPYTGNERGYLLIKPTYRRFLQELGTQSIRNTIHPHAWQNILMREYKPIPASDYESTHYRGEAIAFPSGEQYPNWIISDCRFPNETQAIKDKGGIVVKLIRTKDQWQRTCLTCGHGFDFAMVKDRRVLPGGAFPPVIDYSCPYCGGRNDAAIVQYPSEHKHESETALQNWTFDALLYNTGTVENLVRMGDEFVNHFKLSEYANTNTTIQGDYKVFCP